MTKEELFKKYSIDESHNVWESIDSWMSVEIYRIMHNGNLPPQDDKSIKWVLDFLDKTKNDMPWWVKNVMSRNDWGSLFLTAKRMVYTLSEPILQEAFIMSEFKQFRRKQIAELRPFKEGEQLSERVSISQADKDAGSPKLGDMIARNPKNHTDQWLVAKQYFEDNFEDDEQ